MKRTSPQTTDGKSAQKRKVNFEMLIKPPNLFDREFPLYRQPKEIGYFSTDRNKEFCDDNHMLRFYRPSEVLTNVNFDLTKGYDSFIKKDESRHYYIDEVLKWILLHKDRFALVSDKGNAPQRLNTDFVCWRGVLTKLMCCPYEAREGLKVAVTLYKGTFYLCEFETEQRTAERLGRSQRLEAMCYWGWKFEQYVTSDGVNGKADPSVPVNNKAAYISVVRTRLEEHSLVFGGEVDAVDVTTEPGHYVELKTSREVTTPRHDENFKRFKLLKWWAQSYLLNVPTIVAGFRDDHGTVHRLHTYETEAIPKLMVSMKHSWHPSVCLNALNDILHFIKTSITHDNHRHVHLLSLAEGSAHMTLTDLGADSKYMFLPAWYTDEFGR